jgi:hypothetical protein
MVFIEFVVYTYSAMSATPRENRRLCGLPITQEAARLSCDPNRKTRGFPNPSRGGSGRCERDFPYCYGSAPSSPAATDRIFP